jgi:hypothetical protein
MTGGLRIFEIRLPFGILSAWRNFAGGYRLECAAPLGCGSLTIGEAMRLGRAGEIIHQRFRDAGQYGKDVKTGSVFARREGTRDLIVEIDAVDNDTISVRLFGSSKMTLHDAEAERLLVALCRLADDARALGGGGGSIASRLAR